MKTTSRGLVALLPLTTFLAVGCNALTGVGDFTVTNPPASGGDAGTGGSSMAGASGEGGSGTSGQGGAGGTAAAGAAGSAGVSGSAGNPGGSAGQAGASGMAGMAGNAGSAGAATYLTPNCSLPTCSMDEECFAANQYCMDFGPHGGKRCAFFVDISFSECEPGDVAVATEDFAFACVPSSCVSENVEGCTHPLCETESDCQNIDNRMHCIDTGAVTNGIASKRCLMDASSGTSCQGQELVIGQESTFPVCLQRACLRDCIYDPPMGNNTDCPAGSKCTAFEKCFPPSSALPNTSTGAECPILDTYVGTPCTDAEKLYWGVCALTGGNLPLRCVPSCDPTVNPPLCAQNDKCIVSFQDAAWGGCAPTPMCGNNITEGNEECDGAVGCTGCKYQVNEVEPNEYDANRSQYTPGFIGYIGKNDGEIDQDAVTFFANAGDVATISITGAYDAQCTTTPGAGVKIATPTFVLVDQWDLWVGEGSFTSNDVCPVGVFGPLEQGTHTVVISSWYGGMRFPYTLSVNLQ